MKVKEIFNKDEDSVVKSAMKKGGKLKSLKIKMKFDKKDDKDDYKHEKKESKKQEKYEKEY